MNQIEILTNEHEVLNRQFTIYGTAEEPLFLAKDVAEWIEHSDVSTMLRNVDENEKVTNIVCTPGGNQKSWFLTEDGLYEVLMQSRKPIAKQFKTEVKRILKTIRNHGGYLTPAKIEEVLTNPDTIIKLAQDLKAEREKRIKLEAKQIADRPKTLFADAVCAAETSILVGDLAKILRQNGIEIGQKRLFDWLRENGYLIRRNGSDRNMPTQRAMEMRLFEIKETVVTHADGHITVNKTPKVTGKGQVYFVNCFLKWNALHNAE